jgi:hypothetical protein
MRKIDTTTKWTRGRSRVERPTKRGKNNISQKESAFYISMKFLNSLTGKNK